MHPIRSGKSSRTHTGSAVPWIVLAVLMLGVAMIFIGRYLKQQQDTVAEVGGARITRHDVALKLRMHLWRDHKEWDSMPDDQRSAARQQVLDALIDEHLALQQANHDQVMDTTLNHASEAAFQQFIKQFESLDHWKQRVEGQQQNEVTLRNMIRQETQHTLLLEQFLQTQAPTPSAEAVQSWFQTHGASMTIPESAHASHLFLTLHDAEKPAPETAIRAFYQQLITEQKTLQELAAQFTDDPLTKKTRGDLGWFSRDRVPADFADVVFALTPGELSNPFRTKIGWHIVLLHEKRPARPASLDESKQEIAAFLQDQKRSMAIQQWRVKLRENLPVKIMPEQLNLIAPLPVN